MKKELVFEELTAEQKIGLTVTAFLWGKNDIDYVLELIRKRSLGSVWITPTNEHRDELMKLIKETADYPILIMCDAESGIDGHFIGGHNALACTGSEELAYTFGRVTGALAAKLGYNVICDPVLDMVKYNCCCGGTVRSMGSDKYKVTALAKAEARGLHDGGVLTVAKHYPGATESGKYNDSHMSEATSAMTKEELLEYNLYPYLELFKDNLIDGIMVGHKRFVNIDPDYPASLSPKLTSFIRELGFDGFLMTDALNMMGVVAKFGREGSIGLSVSNGIDLSLPFTDYTAFAYEATYDFYKNGTLTDERLDDAVRKVLFTMSKVNKLTSPPELTEEDFERFDRINTDTVFAKCDEGLTASLDTNGRYYFVILTETSMDISNRGKVAVDTFSNAFFDPIAVADKLEELFPNSKVGSISEYPSAIEIKRLFDNTLGYETVFITYYRAQPYLGVECFTSRITSLMRAMQVTDRISTVLHFGNPFVLEDLPHVPRLLIGTISKRNVECGIEVLAGKRLAKGVLTYDVDLK